MHPGVPGQLRVEGRGSRASAEVNRMEASLQGLSAALPGGTKISLKDVVFSGAGRAERTRRNPAVSMLIPVDSDTYGPRASATPIVLSAHSKSIPSSVLKQVSTEKESPEPNGGTCGACHGADHKGTVLSRAPVTRTFNVESTNRTVLAAVFAVRVGRTRLYLLDTDLEENAPWDRGLS